MPEATRERASPEGAPPAPSPAPARPAEARRWPARAVRAAVLALAVGLLVLVYHTIFDMLGSRPISAVVAVPGGAPALSLADPRAVRQMELLTGTRLLPGNRVEMLADGDSAYARLWADLRAARRSITVQHYYCAPGAVADSLAEVLTGRARAGVAVFFLGDGLGCRKLDGAFVRRLRAAGVSVRSLRPIKPFTLHKAQHRSHVRLTVIDGRIGYTGGFGIADKWSARAQGKARPWRDTEARFEGPAAAQLQAAFVSAWAESSGQLLAGEALFPTLPPLEGGVPAGILYTTPTVGTSTADRFYALSTRGAGRTLYITNSYFVPSRSLRRMLLDAARRGVDVRVLTAGSDIDVPLTWYAGRSHYDELLRAGVRIYEYRGAMLHAKTLVADGVWVSIGAMNFDERSVRLNDEANLLVYDRGLGVRMDSLFQADLRSATAIDPARFARRPVLERLLERGARLLSAVL